MTQMTSLHDERLEYVCSIVKASGARSVLDLGCGSGSLLYRLLDDSRYTGILGIDQSGVSLAQARAMLKEHLLGSTPRLKLLCASYMERNELLRGFDVAVMVETIEHVQPAMLSGVEQVVFGYYQPRVLFMTTPNREYNPLYDLGPGEFREEDHKFEWDRAKFRHWATGVAVRNGYRVKFGGIGQPHQTLGQPTQTALFSRAS